MSVVREPQPQHTVWPLQGKYDMIDIGCLFYAVGVTQTPVLSYLEGHGDLVSRLITPISKMITPIIPIINLLSKSP